jgi:microcystin-dependent protein
MSEPYLGEIRPFAGNYAPEGWHMCDGSLLPINTYQALYSLIGTAYGGNGQTTFGIPDFRGRLPVGQGQGAGLTNRIIGQTGGTSTVQINDSQMPLHTHNVLAVGGADATTATISSGAALAKTPGQVVRYAVASATAEAAIHQMAAGAITPSGGSASHVNLMPYLAIQFIIALQGLYPTRP